MKKTSFRLILVFAIKVIVISNPLYSATYDIIPSGVDDANSIQSALDELQNGDTVRLSGNFNIGSTLYLPSDFTWILRGSLTLMDNAVFDNVGQVKPGVDARQHSGISETPGGSTNITMSGGTYFGNAINQKDSIRLINFVSVTQSSFHDMFITDASEANFVLGPGSNNNECRNLLGTLGTVNAFSDKGEYNKWYNCIVEDCRGDGWAINCRNSEFNNCVARRNNGAGFVSKGLLDGSVDIGELIEGNKFNACASYNNVLAGIDFSITAESGQNTIIRNNFIQGKFYNNQLQGILLKNERSDGLIENNQVDIIAFENRALKVEYIAFSEALCPYEVMEFPISKPVNTQNEDVMILITTGGDGYQETTEHEGWTKFSQCFQENNGDAVCMDRGRDLSIMAFYRVAGDTEPLEYTLRNVAGKTKATIHTLRNVDANDPIFSVNVINLDKSSCGTTFPSTEGIENGMLLLAAANDDDLELKTPSEVIKVFSAFYGGDSHYIFRKKLTSNSYTAEITAENVSCNTTSNKDNNMSIVLRPK